MNGTIYVVEDDAAQRDLLAELFRGVSLRSAPYSSADAFWTDYRDDLDGCVLTDIRMPGMSGLELQRNLVAADSPMPVVFLTAHADISASVQAIKAGAVDFLEKPCRTQQVIDTVRAALRLGETRRSVRRTRAEIECRFALLSVRERQVLDLFISGGSTKQIAKQLRISEKTVAAHRTRLYEKLQVDSVVDMIHLAAHVDAFHPRDPQRLASA